jgi:hypothetical protein
MTKHLRFTQKLMVLLTLGVLLSGCNLPSSPAAEPTLSFPPTMAAPLVTIIPKQPDLTPGTLSTATSQPTPPMVVLPSYTPAPSLTPVLKTLNRKDANSIVEWVRYALDKKDSKVFDQLTADKLSYTNYLEGGQPVDKAKLLGDLKTRLTGSSPLCSGLSLYDQTLQIWTTGWTPDWQINQLCYMDCNPVSPPYQSAKAAFFFNPNKSGEYELTNIWLNDDKFFREISKVNIQSCSEPVSMPTAAALTCPGAPPTRLHKNDYAYASTASTTSSNIRASAGTSASIVGQLKPGKAVQIIDGPQCADGYVWWKVRLVSSALTGWTAEGTSSDYWLVPCGSSPDKCGPP